MWICRSEFLFCLRHHDSSSFHRIPVVLVDALRGENVVVPTEKDCGIVLGDKIQTGLHQQLSLMQCLDYVLTDYAKQNMDE